LFLRVWRPRQIWHFADESPAEPPRRFNRREIVAAWVPWVLLTGFVFVWGLPQVKTILGQTTVRIEVPSLHLRVAKAPPVVANIKKEDAFFDLQWLAATGTGIFLAALASAVWLRLPPARI